MIAKKIFLTKGVGVHENKLFSFELALRDSGVEGCNLVPVSSIFPPGCAVISKEEGLKYLKDGAVTFCVMARNQANANKLIFSSVGLCFAKNTEYRGYFFEDYSPRKDIKESGQWAENMAEEMLMTYLDRCPGGLDKKPEIFKTSISQSAQGKKNIWTTTVAIAVFID